MGAFISCVNLTIYGYTNGYAEEYANANEIPYAYRIQRFEALQQDIVKTCNELYKTELSVSEGFYKTLAPQAYNRSMFDIQRQTGMGFAFSAMPDKTVNRILAAQFAGGHYSESIWKNTSKLAERIQVDLLDGFMSGKAYSKIADEISHDFAVGSFEARRLVRTEGNYIANCAELESYKEAGIDEYRFIATLDNRTSKLCQSLDRKAFPVSKGVPGENMPPMHPFCRSTTIAVIDVEGLEEITRRAKDPKTGKSYLIPGDMNYQEWYEKYVDKNGKKGYNKEKTDNNKENLYKMLNIESGGRRNETPLTFEEQKEAVDYAVLLGMPKESIHYSDFVNTAYGETFDILQIGTDVLPNPKNANTPNSRVSLKGAIAHEIIGHRNASLLGLSQKDDILEEAQASIRAAVQAPELTNSERLTLYRDGLFRLRANGYVLKEVKELLHIYER